MRQFHTHSLVDDPGIPSKERQGFAEVFRRRDDIEDDPRITRIGLLSQVKTESAVLDRLGGVIEEPAFSRSRNAMMEDIALRQVALRNARVAQRRACRDVKPPQDVNCLLGRKAHQSSARQRSALPSVNGIYSGMALRGKIAGKRPSAAGSASGPTRDIARCGLFARANLLHSRAKLVGHVAGWSDPLSGVMQVQEAASPCGPRTANDRSSV